MKPHACQAHANFHGLQLPVLNPAEINEAFKQGGQHRAQLKEKLCIGAMVMADHVALGARISDANSGEMAKSVCDAISYQLDNPGAGEGTLWRRLEDPSEDHTAAWAYLRRCLVFAALHVVRREARALDNAKAQANDETTQTEEEHDLISVDEWLAVLGEQERIVIVLRHIKQMEYTDIALAIGISEVNARKIHQRALERIRQVFHD